VVQPNEQRVSSAEGLAEFLDDWEAEHGALTVEELATAERELQLGSGT
jgi:hypothetical protein